MKANKQVDEANFHGTMTKNQYIAYVGGLTDNELEGHEDYTSGRLGAHNAILNEEIERRKKRQNS